MLGGTLIMTPLNAADGEIYAVAQGAIIAGGIGVEGDAAQLVQGVPTAGSIPAGARVEREVDFDFLSLRNLRLALRDPDFSTAVSIERAVNSFFGSRVSEAVDSGTVNFSVQSLGGRGLVRAISEIENIAIEPEQKARVVVDQRSGTIVIGENVRISRVAVAQGNLTLRVEEEPLVVQPNPFSEGETIVVPRTNVGIEQEPGTGLAEIQGGADLSDVVSGLNALGVSPRDMIDILKTIKSAGALHAEFIVK